MFGRTDPSAAWAKKIALYEEWANEGLDYASLLESVPARLHGSLEVVYANHEIRFFPPGASLNMGSCLIVSRTKAGYSMKITANAGFSIAEPVLRRRATTENATRVLESVLETLLGGVALSDSNGARWEEVVDEFRQAATWHASKAQLLAPVADRWAATCEIYDNWRDLGVLMVGDFPDDGKAVWIRPIAGGWSLQLVSTNRADGREVIKEHSATYADASIKLSALLETMTSNVVTATMTAQEAYDRFVREHLTPLLRSDGFKGTRGAYRRSDGEYQVTIGLRKSRYSTRDRVEYDVHVSVRHPATAERYQSANLEAHRLGRTHEPPEAGDWTGQIPGTLGKSKGAWLSLRSTEDLEAHARRLHADLLKYAYPEVERQMQLVLRQPTPPADRPMRPSREKRDKESLEWTLEMLRDAGVETDIPRGTSEK